VLEYGIRGGCCVRGSEKANGLRAQHRNFLREVLFGTEPHDLPVWSQSSTTGTNLCRVNEEEAGIKERGSAGVTAHSVLPSEVGFKQVIENMKEAETQAIAGIRIELARVVIFPPDWRRRDTNKQDADVTARVRDFVSKEWELDARRPAVNALTACRDALL
jgi:hypothetical protein